MITKKVIPLTILVLISACIFLMGFLPKANNTPKEVYQVYLEGSKIGLINSKEELETYINKEQTAIKNKYKVDTVYVPNGLEIKKVITYNKSISTAKKIYAKIKDLDSFTIKGYVIKVKGESDKKEIYVLDKKIFTEAMDKTIKAFVDPDAYLAYVKAEQLPITTTGVLIEDVLVSEEVVIESDFISANKKIYTTPEELTKYLMYGTDQSQQTYIVKDGETIEQISFNNKLSSREFLVANPDFNSEKVLLVEGQTVNVGLINPQVTVVKKEYSVKDEPKKYTTEIVYDSSLVAGYSYTRQEGINGLNRVSQKITHINGEPTNVEIVGTQELTPAVNQIVVKGDKYVSNVGVGGYWYWPTTTPYLITSYYGYRWGSMHPALDIAGSGHGSPIYSANNGTVVSASYSSSYGNNILINHNNGYYSRYAHLSRMSVKVGQVVERGQVIGGMGKTGYVVGRTGVHLHFEMWVGEPYRGGYSVNPLRYY